MWFNNQIFVMYITLILYICVYVSYYVICNNNYLRNNKSKRQEDAEKVASNIDLKSSSYSNNSSKSEQNQRYISWLQMNTGYEGIHMLVMSHTYKDIRFEPNTHVVIYALANGGLALSGRDAIAEHMTYKCIFCNFLAANGNLLDSTVAKDVYAVNNKIRRYWHYLIVCETSSVDAHSLFLSFEGNNSKAPRIQILQSLQEYRGSLGICIPCIYGSFTTDSREIMAFIEFMEIYRMFGVTEITLYVLQIDHNSDFLSVLEYYRNIGLLVVVINKKIPHMKYDPLSAVPGSINKAMAIDCLYRNMMRYDFIFTPDLDDVLIPRKHNSYTEMLNAIKMNETFDHCIGIRPKDYTFDLPQDKTDNIQIRLFTSKYIKYRIGVSYFMKCLYRPIKCFYADNHGCKPLAKTFDETQILPSTCEFEAPELVSLHHYRRSCDRGYTLDQNGSFVPFPAKVIKCRNSTVVKDSFMSKFEDYLKLQTNMVLDQLNLTSLNSY